jgi:chromosome segregation ATPase
MMSKESRSFADEIEELKTRKSELELQASILASKIRAQKAELDDKKAQHAKFKEYLKKLTSKQKTEIEELQHRLDEKTSLVGKREEQSKNYVKLLMHKHKKEMTELQVKIDVYEPLIVNYEEQIRDLRAQNINIQSRLTNLSRGGKIQNEDGYETAACMSNPYFIVR